MKRALMFGLLGVVFVVLCATCVLALQALPALLGERCDTWQSALSKDDEGHTVWRVEEGCSGFANAATVAIALSQRGGDKTTLFKFYDVSWDADYHGQTTPSVRWIARHHLEISVGAAGEILQKLNKLGDLSITYRIGHVVK